MKKYSLSGDVLIVALGIALGVDCTLGFQSAFPTSRPSLPSVESPRYVASDNAIARFGLAPVNPDWIQVTHRSGQPIEGVPSHEFAVFTFLYEPHVEKVEQPNGSVLWKVTFEP